MKKERQRKTEIKRGEVTQKMMTFRLDNDLTEILNTVKNKGRLINNLLREYMTSRNVDESTQDTDPATNDKEDMLA